MNPSADPAAWKRQKNLDDAAYYLSGPRPYIAIDEAEHAEECCVTLCPHTTQHHKTGCCLPSHWRKAS